MKKPKLTAEQLREALGVDSSNWPLFENSEARKFIYDKLCDVCHFAQFGTIPEYWTDKEKAEAFDFVAEAYTSEEEEENA